MLISYKLQPSRIFFSFLLFASLISLVVILILPMNVLGKLVCVCLSQGVLMHYLLRDVLLILADSVVVLSFRGDQASLISNAGSDYTGKIIRQTIVTPFLTILIMLPDNHRLSRSVVIFSDGMDTEAYRELRVRLRFKPKRRS